MKNVYSIHWIKFRISFIFLLLFAFTATGQVSLSWVNKNAYELKSDATNKDLLFLSKELKGKNIVGLGEASHGTREFYLQKARIIEYLINKCEFKLLCFESPQATMAPINIYLQTGEGNLRELMRHMYLYSTEEIFNLFERIRQYNKGKVTEDKVVLMGMDHEDYWGDPYTRDKLMTENLIRSYKVRKSKTIVWTHNVHMLKDTISNSLAMGSYLNQHFGNAFYAIGFDTFKGMVNVLHDGEFEMLTFQAQANSLSNMLAQARYKTFFLPFPQQSPFIGTTSLITNIYANRQEPKPLPIKPGVDFDAIIFIRDTSASIKLSQ
ncbi:erythromycin esterase family protein [Pedobacter immunditicola]|uniref:erythromycin esterase family protein n=1 Tax=Pedobacter immunditicola TaxID=3133440 RepID=UPI00309BCF02